VQTRRDFGKMVASGAVSLGVLPKLEAAPVGEIPAATPFRDQVRSKLEQVAYELEVKVTEEEIASVCKDAEEVVAGELNDRRLDIEDRVLQSIKPFVASKKSELDKRK
jgi:hypothetical protein